MKYFLFFVLLVFLIFNITDLCIEYEHRSKNKFPILGKYFEIKPWKSEDGKIILVRNDYKFSSSEINQIRNNLSILGLKYKEALGNRLFVEYTDSTFYILFKNEKLINENSNEEK